MNRPLIVGLRVDAQKPKVIFTTVSQSARGTKFFSGSAVVDRAGKSKEEFMREVREAIDKLMPPAVD